VVDFPAGAQFVVVLSTGNNGLWYVSSAVLVGASTEITVTGNITNATADGFIWPRQTNTYTFNAALLAGQVVEAIRIK
jgi:hypothetical protein